MVIRECVSVNSRDGYSKSRYLNKLHIQEEREFRTHLIYDMTGYFRVNREKHQLNSGFFFITRPEDHYTITPDQARTSQAYYLTTFELEEDDGRLASYIEEVAGMPFRLKPTRRFDFDDILSRMRSTGVNHREAAKHSFLSLLYRLADDQEAVSVRSESRETADRAISFMQERIYGELTLNDIAAHLNLSVPHFVRIFKAKMGLPPMKYYTRIRVEEAAGLLMNSDRPLAAIAEELNFSSPAHFSKVFKQYMGISPVQYRNNYINTLENRQIRSVQEIEKAYSLLENIINESPDLIFYKDVNGIMIGCNQAICDILGLQKEEIIGRSDYDLFSPEKAEFFIQRDEVIFRTNRPYKNEEWMTYPDGRRRKFEVYKAPFHDSEGKILGLIGISRDITDRDEEYERRIRR